MDSLQVIKDTPTNCESHYPDNVYARVFSGSVSLMFLILHFFPVGSCIRL